MRVGQVILGLTAAVMVAVPVAAQTAASSSVTFTKDIAPILQRSCQRCHRPDSVAPMSLLTYEQARPYARAMKQRTALARAPWARGSMPPWFLEKNIGIQKIQSDPSLSDAEIAMFGAWADNGAPEGDPKDMPPPLTFLGASEWEFGKPDLVVSSPTFYVPALASDNAIGIGKTPTTLTEDRYISKVGYMEVTKYVGPKAARGGTIGSLFVIHHGGVSIGQADQELGEVQDETGDETQNSNDRRGQTSLGLHEVGRNGEIFPPDGGKLLPGPRSTLFFDNLHVHASGEPGSERIARLDVGLYLHPKGYKPKYSPQGFGLALQRPELQINPLQANQRVDAYLVLTQPTKVLSFEPHMHAAGVRMCVEAVVRNVSETLSCAGYDHNWVRNYQYEENSEPLLPAGTILHLMGWIDNTAKNANVVDPRNPSNFGNSSVSNMFILFGSRIGLTDEQYQEELAKRREYLRLTEEPTLGCPDCYNPPGRSLGDNRRGAAN